MPARRLLLPALVAGLLAAACGGTDAPTAASTPTATEAPSGASASPPTTPTEVTASPTATEPPTATTSPTATPSAAADTPVASTPPSADPRPVALAPFLAPVRFDRPVDVFALPGDAGAVYVVDQGGVLYRLDEAGREAVLDLRGRVSRSGNEEGLLSMHPDPAYTSNGRVWAYYSAASPRRSVLSVFTRAADGTFDATSELVVLEVPQPFSNHNGGAIRFGPDGMLYLGLGDGGSAGDPEGHGQDPTTLLGSILRLDVRDASAARPYRVPADNPLVGGTGVRAEVWAYGLRNPWRMEFDPATGALWLGDVGQNAREEISIATAGANLGWKVMEGDRCYGADNCNRTGLTMPVAVYGHGSGRCSVTGGPVVRGGGVPEVEGAYLYADFCSGEVWALRADLQGESVRVLSGAGSVAAVRQVGTAVLLLSFGEPVRQIASP